MVLRSTRSGRVALAALVALALLSLAAPLATASTPRDAGEGSPIGLLRQAMMAAIGSSGAVKAMDTLGNSLALLGARYRIEERATAEGEAGATAEAPASADPAPLPSEDEEVDPSTLPPASAGTNGSHVPHAASLRDVPIVANSRGDESNAILLSGIALAPPNAPEVVKNVINAANTIVGRPYIWGGGHQSWYSNGYDCSGSVSFALFGGGLIPRPLTSGELEGWGAPGPGKWITVYANPHHTFAEIAGLRWDTVGDALGSGPRWHLPIADDRGFVVRHPPGY